MQNYKEMQEVGTEACLFVSQFKQITHQIPNL